MKTQDQILKIEAREIFAWLVLTFAVLLFGITVTFAQGVPAKEDGKIRIRIEKEENGKKTKIDTTFSANDKDKLRDYMNSLDEDLDLTPLPPPAPKGMVVERRLNNARMFHFDDKDLEKLKSDIRDMHIEMFSDSAFPGFPSFEMDGEEFGQGASFRKWHGGCIQLNMDSLCNARVMLGPDGDDDAEEIRVESRTDDDNGSQVIIIRKSRKNVDGSDQPGNENMERMNTKDHKLVTEYLETYPNPGNGRFTLNFNLEKRGELKIRITDASGREVFSETRSNFSGDYSKQVDISKEGKGAYLLTITQDGQSVTKKIVVE